ncbi:MAG TPA: HEPN domain-containing protein [Chitinophaga sp.]|uniref:HEPN domain-containing protein n=1 Tax=Chitinophaga sp. TaxID=1869181 RepID=UPI002C205665|nr:HEPN domain-containing protein [Chitinophaga sp.]HVI45213.1 HEPN domain-containing protein [Chitinophaga sp.]
MNTDIITLRKLFFSRTKLDQQTKPIDIVRSFFYNYSLAQTRSYLWGLLEADLTSGENRKKEVSNEFFSFYKQLSILLDAVSCMTTLPTRKPSSEINVDPKEMDADTVVNSASNYQLLLDRVISTINSLVQPEKIFLTNVSQTVDGDNEIMNLFVVLPDTALLPFEHYIDLIQTSCKSICPVVISVHRAGYVNKMIEQGHIFFSSICQQKYLVYSNGQATPPIVRNNKFWNIKGKARWDFGKRLSKAEAFLDGARYLAQANHKEIAAFMLHQAVEQAITTLLYSLTGNIMVTHNLFKLIQLSKQCTEKVASIFPNETADEKMLFTLLSKAYINARYYKYKINDLQLFRLEKEVTRVLETASAVFNEELLQLNEKHKMALNNNNQNLRHGN